MATKHSLEEKHVLLPLAVLGVLAGVDVTFPPQTLVSSSYGVAALVACAITTVRITAVFAVAGAALAALSAIWNDNFATLGWWIHVAMTIGIGILAVILAQLRTSREQDLRHMTTIAEAAQRAVLRTIPSSLGSLRFATRYVSATKEALVGGDLYEVVQTLDGVRVIVGDARGKGLDAVQMAATVLAAFRRAAVLEVSLAGVVAELDNVVTAVAGDEDFVTAVLAEFRDDNTVTLVNCGHHPPLLLTNGDTGSLVDTGEPQPPLGLGPVPKPVTRDLPECARMLFYTDGLVEARNRDGDFFPLAERAPALAGGSLDDALDGLLGELVRHAADEMDDDMALVLAERQPA
jgi:sigma-B regulation protein RsbU (phosphoserine phosphatase)